MRKLIGEIFGRHGSEDAQREYLLSKGMKVGKIQIYIHGQE